MWDVAVRAFRIVERKQLFEVTPTDGDLKTHETTPFGTKAQATERYRAIMLEATAEFRCTSDELLRTLAGMDPAK